MSSTPWQDLRTIDTPGSFLKSTPGSFLSSAEGVEDIDYNVCGGDMRSSTAVLAITLSLPLLSQIQTKDPKTLAPSGTQLITVTQNGGLFLNGVPVNVGQLAGEIQRTSQRGDVFLRADRATTWDSIARVLRTLESAQPPISVKLITEPREQAR